MSTNGKINKLNDETEIINQYTEENIPNTDIGSPINITPASSTDKSNIVINNTLGVNFTDPKIEYNEVTNSNAGIFIKDRTDGIFKDLYVEDNDLYIVPKTYDSVGDAVTVSSPVQILRYDEFETILSGDANELSYGNVNIKNGYYVRFLETDDVDTDTSFIAFRQENGKIEYRNKTDSSWQLLSAGGGGGVSNFYDLQDVDIMKVNTQTYEYIKFNGTNELINSNLSISDDNTPALGGELDTTGFDIKFSGDSSIIDSTGNTAIQVVATDSNTNFLSIRKERNSSDEDVVNLHADSSINTNANMRISTRGSGDLEIDLNDETDTTKGDFIVKAAEFSLPDVDLFNMSTGKFVSSLDFKVLSDGGYSTDELNPTSIDMDAETIVLQINGNGNTYYLSLTDGLSGQKGNIVFETEGTGNSVVLTFKTSGGVDKNVGTGTGLANKMIFATAGQSAMLQYYEFSGFASSYSRNRWQILNTGCAVE
jgi:hypothetical protein